MSQQYKVYGDVVQEYYIIVTAENRDEAWYAAVAAPKKGWQKVSEGKKIEPYNIEELEDTTE
jgi:hypothetical protein